MTNRFQKYLREDCGVTKMEKVLVAVSGGVDSTILCYFFKMIGQPFVMAHCNFQLRGEASDGDEVFVKDLAKALEVPYFVQHFETYKLAIQQKKSVQIIARELRYEWLEMIRQQENCSYLATAHHLNDSVETVLYNLTKGCGIHGLHGILPINGVIIRPLLWMTKTQIREFAAAEEIRFRTDDSNETDKYARNFIRHQIVPRLQSINPNVEQTFSDNIQRFREVESLYFQAIETIKQAVCKRIGEALHIDIQAISKNDAANSILYEILKPYHFNNSITSQILKSKDSFSGKTFYSKTHLAVLDRTHLIVDVINEDADKEFIIQSLDETVVLNNKTLSFQKLAAFPTEFSRSKNVCYVDFDKLKFPLTIRKWRKGDSFQPFGMKGKSKKVANYYQHQKLSKHDKDKTWIMESGNKIVWIIGHRSDERFRVNSESEVILMEIK